MNPGWTNQRISSDLLMISRDSAWMTRFQRSKGGWFVHHRGTANVPRGKLFELPLEFLVPEIKEWLIEQRAGALLECHWDGIDYFFELILDSRIATLFKLTWA